MTGCAHTDRFFRGFDTRLPYRFGCHPAAPASCRNAVFTVWGLGKDCTVVRIAQSLSSHQLFIGCWGAIIRMPSVRKPNWISAPTVHLPCHAFFLCDRCVNLNTYTQWVNSALTLGNSTAVEQADHLLAEAVAILKRAAITAPPNLNGR